MTNQPLEQPSMTPLPEDEARKLAIKQLKAKRDFMSHAVAYVVVNTFLVIVWWLGGADYFWPIWVLAGWGIGLALNAWEVYGRRPITESDIEEEMHRR